jgi:hypothetical protein
MTISTDRMEGNALFSKGDYAGAIAAYERAINAITDCDHEVSIIYSNQAECHLKLGENETAAMICEKSLKLDPCNAKSHARLARSLSPDSFKAAVSVCSALALLEASSPSSLVELYSSIQKEHKSWLPLDLNQIQLIRPGTNLDYSGEYQVKILCPGKYETNGPIPFNGRSSMVMALFNLMADNGRSSMGSVIGLGDVTIKCNRGHVFYTYSYGIQYLSLYNLNLIGDGDMAAVCCADGTQLKISKCTIKNNSNGGVLICGASATISQCSFIKCTRMAIEVREGGSLSISDSVINECYQGVAAYGGARDISIDRCTISNCTMEGIMIAGNWTNAATEMQLPFIIDSRSQISKEADTWGKRHGTQLIASITNSTISGCRNFGISADSGAIVHLDCSKLLKNLPSSLIVKGKTDICVSACQFIFSGKAVPNPWGLLKKAVGIYIGVNYGGEVDIIGNAFCGPSSHSVCEELKMINSPKALKGASKGVSKALKGVSISALNGLAIKTGMWSKPASCRENLEFSAGDAIKLPSIYQLAQRIPGHRIIMPQPTSDQGKKMGDLGRICWTERSIFPWSHSSQYYYPIGNSVGFNILENYSEEKGDVKILLGACGDIRNLLATVFEASDIINSVAVTMNDENVTMLARNLVLLYLCAHSSPDVVIAVWANHGLTEWQGQELFKALQVLSSENSWPEWLETEPLTKTSILEVLKSWLECTLSLQELLKMRESSYSDLELLNSIQISVAAVGPQYQKAIEKYLNSGSLTPSDDDPLVMANVTMVLAPSMQYCVYVTTSIFRIVSWESLKSRSGGAYKVISSVLQPQICRMGESLCDGRVKVRLVMGDIVCLMTNRDSALIHDGKLFDFIDCTNVIDYVGLAVINQIASPILNKTTYSRLSYESMREFKIWRQNEANSSLVDDQFVSYLVPNLPIPSFEKLTGLKMVDTKVFKFTGYNGQDYIRLLWAPNCEENLLKYDSLEKDLMDYGKAILASTSTEKDLLPAHSQAMPSPLSFVHLIWRSFPENCLALISKLASNDTVFSVNKLEMTMHAIIQMGSKPDLVVVEYEAKCGYEIILTSSNPLVLVFSLSPLDRGMINHSQIKHLLTAFSWNGDTGKAKFRMGKSMWNNVSKWYITMAYLSPQGIRAIGTCALVSTLNYSLLEKVHPSWRV